MDELGPDHPLSKQASDLSGMRPGLLATVTLYSPEDGGRQSPAYPGWGCPCVAEDKQPLHGWDAWPILETAISPGETRANVPFVFLTEEGQESISKLEKFFLWEGKVIGEAVVVHRT